MQAAGKSGLTACLRGLHRRGQLRCAQTAFTTFVDSLLPRSLFNLSLRSEILNRPRTGCYLYTNVNYSYLRIRYTDRLATVHWKRVVARGRLADTVWRWTDDARINYFTSFFSFVRFSFLCVCCMELIYLGLV